MRKNTLRRALVASALIIGLVVVPATSGSAHQWTDPAAWGGGHQISYGGAVDDGNIVKVWQAFLHDRYGGFYVGPPCGGSPCNSGHFDLATKNTTLFWQYDHAFAGLTVDGIVGTQTWNAARFFHLGAPIYSTSTLYIYHYTDTVSTSDIRYSRPFATWGIFFCTGTFAIDHPAISENLFSYNCD